MSCPSHCPKCNKDFRITYINKVIDNNGDQDKQ